jgi:hypothetical protein
MMDRSKYLVLAAVFCVASSGTALDATRQAVAAESSYTRIAEKHCRKFDRLKIDGSEFAASRVCEGRGGYKIFIREDDLRETLTIGKTLKQAASEPAASDQYGAFNSYDDTVEWRSGADGKPYAAIVGWSYADNENPDANGRPKSLKLLVVMRLPPGAVCKVAYVDRVANSGANALARKAADKIAPNFKCGADKVQIVGARGRAIEAMAPTPDSANGTEKP